MRMEVEKRMETDREGGGRRESGSSAGGEWKQRDERKLMGRELEMCKRNINVGILTVARPTL